MTAFAAGPASINLGSASNFAVLSKTGISTTGFTQIVGDIGVSPISATSITGFGLNLSSGSAFSTSPLVSGKVYAPDYAVPTPANLTSAIGDMQNAYTDGAGRTNPNATELGAGNLGGLTIAPGFYKWGTGVTIPTDVTLSGSANDVWIFQIAQTLTVSSGVRINLSGGAQANNVFWVVAGQTTLGTTVVFNGNILDQTAIVLNTGAKLNGRALAQTAVTLDSNTVTIPSGSTPAVVSNPTPTPTPTPSSSSSSNTGGSSSGSWSSQTTTTTSVNQTTASTNDTGCLSGNRFSIMTGNICPSFNASVSSPVSSFGEQIRTIAISLGLGSRDNNVTILQQFLISQNKGYAAVALANVGPTGYFGAITRSALAEFQAKVGISPALGNFGPITRGYISTH